MNPPDRVDELRRQRAVIQAHLDWLDREIARTSGEVTPPVAAPAPIPPTPPAALDSLPNFEPDPVSAAGDAKRGCLLWFLAVVLLGGAAIAAVLFWRYRDHPMLFMPDDSNPPAASSSR